MAYCSRPGQDYREGENKESHSCNLSASDVVKTKRPKLRGEASVWTWFIYANTLKSAYLSVWGDLFRQLNLSGSCSRYESFVLETVNDTETVAIVQVKQ